MLNNSRLSLSLVFDSVSVRFSFWGGKDFSNSPFLGISRKKKRKLQWRHGRRKEGKNRLNSNEATFLQPGAMRESKWGVAAPHKDRSQLLEV